MDLFISAQDASTAPLSETTMEKLRPTLDSKIWGAFHVVKHSVSQIRAEGSITFISGLAGRRGYPSFAIVVWSRMDVLTLPSTMRALSILN
ncbi:hypothetical protein [Floridanema evergladense]|uniref:Uncharacterized protein n=1 Tax=Floridaenema evergladense BLCC-F167 TaxID=3153639 RepID=A0ABV4WJ37_9CYAN